MRRGRGLTLAETLVAGGLLVLLLGFLVPVWNICWRTWGRGEEVQSAQRDTLALSFRLRRDFSASRPESLRVQRTTGDVLISFLSLDAAVGQGPSWSPKGDILWKKWVQYFFDSTQHRVLRKEVPLEPPTEEPSLTPPPWSLGGSHAVANHVQEFRVTSEDSEVVFNAQILTRDGQAESATRVTVLPSVYALDNIGY